MKTQITTKTYRFLVQIDHTIFLFLFLLVNRKPQNRKSWITPKSDRNRNQFRNELVNGSYENIRSWSKIRSVCSIGPFIFTLASLFYIQGPFISRAKHKSGAFTGKVFKSVEKNGFLLENRCFRSV